MRNKNRALFTILLLALAALVVTPFVMGGTGMMTSVGMYPGMMSGYVGVGWGMLAGGVMMVALWVLAIAGAVLLVQWLTDPEPSATDVLRKRYAAGDITREQYDQMLAALGERKEARRIRRAGSAGGRVRVLLDTEAWPARRARPQARWPTVGPYVVFATRR